jgi:putative PIN family toxin of toxin-antitoxin system
VLDLLSRIAEIVPIIHTIRAYRDARDDKFLELAVTGESGLIITGDADLLELDPFQNIPIITPASCLGR